MNDIERLYHISQKDSRVIIGLMSGTSVDGLDMAICKFSGSGKETQFQLLHFDSVEFPQHLRQQILSFLGKRNVDLLELTLLHTEFAIFTANAVLDLLKKVDFPISEVDLISSHGQTIFHAPKSFHHFVDRPNATLQIGDGDHIAALTGIITIHDLRQKHVAKGGEGAPLALYGDYILYASEIENRALLNIGGISNFTFIPKDKSQVCWATDVGPGNTIMDELCRKHFQVNFDNEGAIAKRGRLHVALLARLEQHPYLAIPHPKTTGQEAFNLAWFEKMILPEERISPEDQICTAAHFTAKTIAKDINLLPVSALTIYVSGGGSYNLFLMNLLSEYLNTDIKLALFDELGISSSAKEAVLFAFLANENFAKTPTVFPFEPSQLNMGKISMPN